MTEEIKTSVIIPVYNTEKYLEECIQSVLHQTQKETEIILVDDGSTDGSRIIMENYQRVYPNVRTIYQKNQKQGAARNAGLEIATGKYVYFLDSDDYIGSDLLEQCFETAEKKQTDFVFFDAYSFSDSDACIESMNSYDRSQKRIPDKVMSGVEFWRKWWNKGGVYVCPWMMYTRRDFLIKTNCRFLPNVFYEDNEWCLNLHKNAERIYYIPAQYYYRRYHDNSTMTSTHTHVHFQSAITVFMEISEQNAKEEVYEKSDMTADIAAAMAVWVRMIWEGLNQTEKNDCQELLETIGKKMAELEKEIISEELLISVLTLHYFLLQGQEDDRGRVSLERRIKDIILRRYRLQETITVAVYGMGKRCEEIFEWYKKYACKICADIEFLSTDPTEDTYMDYPVKAVQDVKGKVYDHIIIASRLYSDEMLDSLEKYRIQGKSVCITLRKMS